jgi:predicted transcriptional regulator
MNINTAISELLRTILDKEWHAAYEMHNRFRLSALEIYEAIAVLQQLGIVERQGTNVRLSERLEERHLSIMNRLSKTYRPPQLEVYIPKPLTTRNNQVS